jgi:hypothetical protein
MEGSDPAFGGGQSLGAGRGARRAPGGWQVSEGRRDGGLLERPAGPAVAPPGGERSMIVGSYVRL